MDRGVAVIWMALVGCLVAAQPAVNAGLAKATGSLTAAFVSFVIGAGLLGLLVAVSGHLPGVSGTFDVPWYYLRGGAIGATYVFTALVTVNSIGAGGVAAATIAGQLAASIVLDRLGVLGLEEVAITWERIAGVGLLAAGTFLVVR